MNIGKTEEDPIPKEEIEKALTKRERATVQGCLTELGIVKQKLENCHEQLRRMTFLYGDLQKEFAEFKAQRIKELTLMVGSGPTVRENGS